MSVEQRVSISAGHVFVDLVDQRLHLGHLLNRRQLFWRVLL